MSVETSAVGCGHTNPIPDCVLHASRCSGGAHIRWEGVPETSYLTPLQRNGICSYPDTNRRKLDKITVACALSTNICQCHCRRRSAPENGSSQMQWALRLFLGTPKGKKSRNTVVPTDPPPCPIIFHVKTHHSTPDRKSLQCVRAACRARLSCHPPDR